MKETPADIATLMADFVPVSKEQWLQQVARDLKDRRLEDLLWQAPGGLVVSPFALRDDFPGTPMPLGGQQGWQICETVHGDDENAANKQILTALQGGVEGINCYIDQLNSRSKLDNIFQGVYLDYIGLHFTGEAPETIINAVTYYLSDLARTHSIPTEKLSGSFRWNPVYSPAPPDWRFAAEMVAETAKTFPNFKLITIKSSVEEEAAENAVSVLTSFIRQADNCLNQISAKGAPKESIARLIQFEMGVGKSYFLEIAKLRALRILWLNLLKKHEIPLLWPTISAHLYSFDLSDKESFYTNMIRSVTMAMSAVIGGANRLTIQPANALQKGSSEETSVFCRRIARNVQHLLKMESYMDTVSDPAAGSYYIEQLTRQIAEKAWENR